MNYWKGYFNRYRCVLDSSKMICSVGIPMDSLLVDLRDKAINDSILEFESHTLNSIKLRKKSENREGIGVRWEKTIIADLQVLPNPLIDYESLIYINDIRIFKKRKNTEKYEDIIDDYGVHKNEFVQVLINYYYGRQ
jgi:hypothetical protein